MRLRVRPRSGPASATATLTLDAAATLGDLTSMLGGWVSLNNQTPLTGPPNAPLATLGLRPGDLLYGAAAPPAAFAPPPPLVARGLTPRADALLTAAATGIPAPLRAALETAAQPVPVPLALALAAAACLAEAGWESEGGASNTSLLPPGWAPALSAPPLTFTLGGAATATLQLRVFDLGAFTMLAGAAGGRAVQVAVRTSDHALPSQPGPSSASGDACPPLARVRELVISLTDGLVSPLVLAAAEQASPPSIRPPTGLLDLPPHLLAAEVLPRLLGADLGRLACVARPLGAMVEDDRLWSAALAREFPSQVVKFIPARGTEGRGFHPRRQFAELSRANRLEAAHRRVDAAAARLGRGGLWLPGGHPFPFLAPGGGGFGGGGWVPGGGRRGGGAPLGPPGVIGGLFGGLGGGRGGWQPRRP